MSALTLRPLGTGDLALVAQIQASAADYFHLERGQAPDQATAEAFFTERPPAVPAANHLHFAICLAGEPVGLIDLLLHYPAPGDAYLGLLLLRPDHRRGGLGQQVLRALRPLARARGATQMRVAVLAENAPGMAFWSAQGFETEAVLPGVDYGGKRHEVHRRIQPLIPAPDSPPAEIIRGYWRAMNSNDFDHAAQWLSEDIRVIWPQSREVIEGRAAFSALNDAYPAQGRWRFDLRDLISDGPRLVSVTEITDGATQARAITFHDLRGGRICRQVEYWPAPYPAPDWRAAWVRPMHIDEDQPPAKA